MPRVPVVLVALLTAGVPVLAQELCPGGGASIDSVEGLVEINRDGTAVWSLAVAGDVLCPGDSIRTDSGSRTSFRLPDGTVHRLGPDAAARWTPTQDRSRTVWSLLRGIIHIISRDPRSLEYTTPFANAGLDGTEFLIQVLDEAAEFTVIEGVVSMRAGDESLAIAAGERGVAARDGAATVGPAPDYLDALDWARDFPILWSAPFIEAYQEPSPEQADDVGFFADRATQRLRRGLLDAAADDLGRAFELDPQHPRALALAALALQEYPDSDIGRLAEQARRTNPDRTLELLTQALAQQGRHDWQGARSSLERALLEDPENSVVWARLAETHVALDNLPAAERAARRAIELDADYADAHTVLGFIQMRSLDMYPAIASFERAVVLDQSLALPHAGLGLAWTQLGDRAAGRREFELAVLLDPADALLRSYAAKAYYDLRLSSPAGSQVDLATLLDDADPTPYLYGAFLDLSANSPVDGLRSFNRAAARNDGRAAYRSALFLDSDPAVSAAGVGQLYSSLGFEQLALAVGTASVRGATRDYAGHRLLGDTYVAMPRHQIARANELQRGQLLQDVTATAIPPQLAEPNMFILDTAGPSSLAHNEFNPLLLSNHVTVQGAATVAGNETFGDYATVSGVNGPFSFSTGFYGFETDGFRPNNDIDTDVGNLFVQFRPNAMLSLIGELRSSDVEKGDLKQLFHDDNYNSQLRQTENIDSLRIGVHRLLGERGDFLAVAQFQDSEASGTVGPALSYVGSADDEVLDLQHLYRRSRWQLTSGATLFSEDAHQTSQTMAVVPVPPFLLEQVIESDFRTTVESVYLYSDHQLSPSVTLTLGASLDELDDQGVVRREFNPKLGLAWAPNERTTVRAAAFSILQGPLGTKENILPRLEPTAVSGFNQFFFGSIGDEVERYGVGIDQRLSDELFYGVELSRRDIDTSIVVIDATFNPFPFAIAASEDSTRVYAYWTPGSRLALSAELQGDIFDNSGYVLADGYARLETLRLPLQVKYFRPGGLGAGVKLTFVDQSGDFGESTPVPGGIATTLFADDDQFWVVDANLTYRLRGRRGMLNLTMHNLFDEEFNFQDLDPENPRIMPERLVSFGFTLAL